MITHSEKVRRQSIEKQVIQLQNKYIPNSITREKKKKNKGQQHLNIKFLDKLYTCMKWIRYKENEHLLFVCAVLCGWGVRFGGIACGTLAI